MMTRWFALVCDYESDLQIGGKIEIFRFEPLTAPVEPRIKPYAGRFVLTYRDSAAPRSNNRNEPARFILRYVHPILRESKPKVRFLGRRIPNTGLLPRGQLETKSALPITGRAELYLAHRAPTVEYLHRANNWCAQWRPPWQIRQSHP